MIPRGRDYAWATFAVLFGAGSALGLINRIVQTVRGDISIALALAGLVIGGLVACWITFGAWRRTVWGQPSN